MAAGPEILVARSLAEAADRLARDPLARVIAGGTAIQLDWAKGLAPAPTYVAVDRIAELQGVEIGADRLRIGAATRLADLIGAPGLSEALPLLATVLPTVAGPSVRNLATIGGNIAGRSGCTLPALLALDAELELHTGGATSTIALADWLARPADPAGILVAIRIPRPRDDGRWTARKVGYRAAFTPSVIGVAGRLDIEDGRIARARLAVGGGIVPPARLRTVEARLEGQSLAEIDWRAIHTLIGQTIGAPADAFRSSAYRARVAANALVAGLSGELPGRVPARRRPMPPDGVTGPEGEVRLGHADLPERWHVRPDVGAKVRGELRYLTEHRAPDMLVGRILRAGRPHARIVSIDTSRAEALAGVAAVITHRDVAGLNAYGIVIQDQPALCVDKVRHAGDVVAAVAAIDEATAEAALAAIAVTYEDLPLVDDPETALAPGAPKVHDSGNLQRILHFGRGDAASGLAGAAHVVERTYVTPRQMHGFMETEGGWAELTSDGTLEVHAGGQHGARDRMQLARILGWPEDRIRVVTSPTGGAFGGKDELTVQPVLALLAIKARRPVRLQLTRAESVLAGLKRNPMTIRMKTGIDAGGRLIAQEVDVLADCGAYASLSPGVLETALEHCAGPYEIAHVRTRGRLAYTNNGLCGAFRGFGANQMAYAVECQMDLLAEAAGLTPFEIRRRNLRLPGTPGYLGQDVAPSERLSQMMDAAEASPLWRTARGAAPADSEIIGVGMALNYHGNGLGSVIPDPAGGRLSLGRDGRIEAAYGLDEMGQGLLPLIVGAVSSELGCGRADVRPIIGDTARAPDSGSTTASRGTHVVWHVARVAGPDLSGRIRAAAGSLLDRDPDDLRLAPGGIAERASNTAEIILSYAELADRLGPDRLPSVEIAFEYPKTDYSAGNARFLFVFGATVARVAVDRVTGQVRVLDIAQHTAAGPVMDVAAYLGQQEGGAIQGLGFTISEDALMAGGRFLTGNLDTYLMPSIADVPERTLAYALETLDAGDGFGPRGAGELGIGAVTPAIANAVRDAIGFTPVVTPFPPQAILDALEGSA